MKKKDKIISIMLDLQGTCDYINDQLVNKFIKQLEIIKEKFNTDYAVICISTHNNSYEEIKDILDIFSRNIINNIKIGVSFYYGGMYNYCSNTDTKKESNFNSNKLETFLEYYINNIEYDNKWFAIVDDMQPEFIYKKFKDSFPMLLCRPSQFSHNFQNNFMCKSTMTKGFNGVVECFDDYIKNIQDLSANQILERQRSI